MDSKVKSGMMTCSWGLGWMLPWFPAPHIHLAGVPKTEASVFGPSFRDTRPGSNEGALHAQPAMRYIRFLKTPRVAKEKGTARSHIYCLITITSDLGDSFLPCDVQLSAEVLSSDPSENVLIWRTVRWTAGMRSLSITFPSPKSPASSLRVRVGVEPRSAFDEYDALAERDSPGIVSVWSAPFAAPSGSREAIKLVERRFRLPNDTEVQIWEETGESIARHLW
jgi:hypothetical protein